MVTPLVTVLMRTYFSSFPLDLVEAARVDGASETFAFARIVLPMSKSVLTIVGLIQAVFLWNELALAEILLVTPDRGTLPMGLIAFKSQFASNPGYLAVRRRAGAHHAGDTARGSEMTVRSAGSAHATVHERMEWPA
jgi:ABC-type glycerol-3-phosphate transport system permease component